MGQLWTAIDALAADDLFGLSEAALLDRERELLRARNRLDAELARTTRRSELAQAPEHDGQRTMASWLRGHGHLSPRAAALLVRNGRALEHLSTVAAACAAGLITAEQLTIIAPITLPANLTAAAALGVDLAGVERVLVQQATGERHDRLAQVVHHYLTNLDPDGREPDPTDQRFLRITRHDDGSRTGSFELDAAGGEKLDTALESILQAVRFAGDTRTRAQQLADALAQLADNALAGGGLPTLRTVKPHVVITIGADDLIGTGADPAGPHEADADSDEDVPWSAPQAETTTTQGSASPADPTVLPHLPRTAQTGFGVLLSTGKIRHLACDSVLTRILLDPDGIPIHHGRTTRVVSPHLRRTVVLRDQHCVFTGCDAPHHWCDVHHLIHWLDGGPTEPENSGLLCERHHTQVHHGFRIQRDPGGRWHTYRPDGTEIIVYPRLPA